jgi:O-antigen/teichoic acid export membrane protein
LVGESWLPAEHGSDPQALQAHVARGLSWTIVDIWGRQALNLAVFVVLARLLTPEAFGLVALAAVFVLFAQVFVDQGLGDALIQRPELTRRQIDTAFWVAMATGSGLTLAGVLLAIPIAAVLQQPDLQPILQVLSLTLVLAAPTSIQTGLMRRELAFRSLALRALAAAVGGGVVGVVMALWGAGAWALVGQQVAASLISVVALWRLSPWRPAWQVSWTDFRQLFSFGANVVGSDTLRYFSRNTDNLLIGVVLGPIPLGFYAVAYRILDVTQTVLVNVARKITFPAFSRLQGDRDRMRAAYLRVSRASSFVILPGYIGLALVAPELIVLLFGHRWAESGPVAGVLLLIGPVLSVGAFSDSMLNAAGHPEVVFRFRLITMVTNVIGFAIAVPFGILAVASAFVVRAYLLLPLGLVWTRRYAGIPIRPYLAQFRSTFVATVVMAVAVVAVKLLVAGHISSSLLLLVELPVGAAAFLASIWLLDRSLVREVVSVAGQALPNAPRRRRPRRLAPADAEPHTPSPHR